MLNVPVAGTRDRDHLTMPCDIETRLRLPERRAAWHVDCPTPQHCTCPAHQHDGEDQR